MTRLLDVVDWDELRHEFICSTIALKELTQHTLSADERYDDAIKADWHKLTDLRHRFRSRAPDDTSLWPKWFDNALKAVDDTYGQSPDRVRLSLLKTLEGGPTLCSDMQSKKETRPLTKRMWDRLSAQEKATFLLSKCAKSKQISL